MFAAIAILFFVLIIGLCIGSFLNVVILRAFSNESIVYPASKCPKCQHPLKWWHNIPIISYIILKGKCGFCKEKISIQYPIIEAVTALMFILVFLVYGISVNTLFAWTVGSILIVLATTDWKEQVVFDMHTYILIGCGLLFSSIVTIAGLYGNYSLLGNFGIDTNWIVSNPLTTSLLGAIAGFVGMEIISRFGYLIAGTRAFGEGDSFIAAGLGAVFGWPVLLKLLILSVIIQILLTMPVYLKKEYDNKNWMTLISLGIFVCYTAAFCMAQAFGWLTNTYAYWASAIVLLIIGLFACREILRGVRNPENRTYMPFGPAMIVAAFAILLV